MNARDRQALRAQLARILDSRDAHVDFDAAVRDWPPALRSKVPKGMAYSGWQLLEHLRLAQRDIYEFCVDPKYAERHWPDDYWPSSPAPPRRDAWNRSIAAFKRDLAAIRRLATSPKVDLFARIPHGSGQTYLRELLLVADHNAYHVGQLVLLRRALGAWGA